MHIKQVTLLSVWLVPPVHLSSTNTINYNQVTLLSVWLVPPVHLSNTNTINYNQVTLLSVWLVPPVHLSSTNTINYNQVTLMSVWLVPPVHLSSTNTINYNQVTLLAPTCLCMWLQKMVWKPWLSTNRDQFGRRFSLAIYCWVCQPIIHSCTYVYTLWVDSAAWQAARSAHPSWAALHLNSPVYYHISINCLNAR